MPAVDLDWSYNLRTYDFHSDSDDCTSNAEDLPLNISDDALLLQELDFSTRQDTVEYKPNPWSIAKFNAASRPTKPAATILRGVSSTQRKPQGTIIDLFKKQSKNLASRSSPRSSVSISRPPQPARMRISTSEKTPPLIRDGNLAEPLVVVENAPESALNHPSNDFIIPLTLSCEGFSSCGGEEENIRPSSSSNALFSALDHYTAQKRPHIVTPFPQNPVYASASSPVDNQVTSRTHSSLILSRPALSDTAAQPFPFAHPLAGSGYTDNTKNQACNELPASTLFLVIFF